MPLSRRTGPRSRGFSLIELLVTVSFIAILAAIAIPRFPRVRELAVDAAVKSDLMNAMKAQEIHYGESGAYSAFTVTDGGTATELDFDASDGVSITATLIDEGVRMTGSHGASSSTWCISTISSRVVKGSSC